jgi:hypothetical protein
VSESAEWAGRPAGKRWRDQRPKLELRPPGILQTGTHRPRKIPRRDPSPSFEEQRRADEARRKGEAWTK